MKNNNGFFMFDLILALSSWMVISSIILPFTILYMKESIKEVEKYESTVLLFEKLHEYLATGQIPPSNIEANGKAYEIILNSQMKEVCIQYEDHNHVIQKICEFWE